MRYVSVGKVVAGSLAVLLLVSVCLVSFGAKQVIAVKASSLAGTANVTKADGTKETLKDTSGPIALPATIEMVGPKGSFWLSIPSALKGKHNTISWTMRQGETLRVSLVGSAKGIRFEYLKGTRKFYLDVNNRENILLVRSKTGTTSVIVLQNRVVIAQGGAARLTCPVNAFASVTMAPAQVSEVEFRYSPEDKYIQVVEILSQVGTVQVTRAGATVPVGPGVTVTQPIGIPVAERIAVPVLEPERIEQSPSTP